MKLLARLALLGIIVFIALQAIRPSIPAKPATAELQAPPEIRRILDKTATAATPTSGVSPGSIRSSPATGSSVTTSSPPANTSTSRPSGPNPPPRSERPSSKP